MKKAIDKLINKELRRMGKSLKREKARCARMYPDWRDDEFNMLDNKFIWGYTEDAKTTPSFLTWDDIYIYYNRADHMFYVTIDTGLYLPPENAEAARMELDRLTKIDEAFRNFLTEIGQQPGDPICFCELDVRGSTTLSEAYSKFYVFLEGYRKYRDKFN